MKAKVLIPVFLISALAMAGEKTAPLSPAEQKIQAARNAVAQHPDKPQPYSDLALALAMRARETSDPTFYAKAEETLKKCFELAPNNFEGSKTLVWILLGKHEFAHARELARELNPRMPDDLQTYSFLVDANVELGNYAEAEQAAQWLLNLRPGEVLGLTRGAYLREIYGDMDGAADLMEQAYQTIAPSETENRAWILTQLAHMQLMTGKLDDADKLLQMALEIFPGYHYALANLARVRMGQGRFADAVDLLRQRYDAAPHAENLFDLAEALDKAGHQEEARAAFQQFEKKALAEMTIADNANRELIFYYADHAGQPPRALRVARVEADRRHDVYTLDAFAWALYANGQYAEARQQIEKALALGIRDAQLFYHAGAIAWKLRDRDTAERYLTESLATNPHSGYASPARQMISEMGSPPSAALRRNQKPRQP